jgi:hypothetical protein
MYSVDKHQLKSLIVVTRDETWLNRPQLTKLHIGGWPRERLARLIRMAQDYRLREENTRE